MVKEHRKVWLFFLYYWVIFGIATFFGQFLPEEWRPTLSMAIFVIIMVSLFTRGFNRTGPIISHVYAILIGLVSYGTFETFINQFNAETFYSIIILGIFVFILFSFIGYYILRDIMSWGKFLFAALLIVIFSSLLNFFLQIDWLSFVITVVGLLVYLGYTMYDLNRMKNRNYRNPRVMGFNLFIDLLMIIKRILQLYKRFGNNR